MSTDDFDEAECLRRVRQQDEAAAGELVAHLYPLVIRIVRSHLPVRTAEEDLAQEVFVKLFTRLDQYERRDGVPLAHWVSRIAVTTCLDALRAEKRRPELRWADLGEAEGQWLQYFVSAESGPPPGDAQDAREIMQKLLAVLPPADRLVINLLDLEEKSVAEISTITGWSKALVKVRAFRARNKLRQIAKQFQTENKL